MPPKALFEMAQVQLPSAAEKQQAQTQIQQAQAMAQQPRSSRKGASRRAPPQMPEIPKEISKMLKKPAQEEVAQFLANDRVRGFVIEIETDSTIQPDEDAEKQRRVEFITAVGGLFQQAAPIVMQAPMLGPFVVETLKFAAAGFRAGRPLEAAIDQLGETIEGMAEQAAQPQEPPVDPVAMAKVEQDKRRVDLEERKFEEVEKPTAAAELHFKDEEHELKKDDHGLKERGQDHAEKRTRPTTASAAPRRTSRRPRSTPRTRRRKRRSSPRPSPRTSRGKSRPSLIRTSVAA